eukprot:TRINITY_DN12359_c0_g1_i4.p2 TRINITY_DN12359_c0_g1~~TRINITY_DN12359_c0_g1_i4.p2  ORF type:complete len:236 (-),score=12.12 TRINITY_DN12359_c0_g1_i4:16-723(-)
MRFPLKHIQGIPKKESKFATSVSYWGPKIEQPMAIIRMVGTFFKHWAGVRKILNEIKVEKSMAFHLYNIVEALKGLCVIIPVYLPTREPLIPDIEQFQRDMSALLYKAAARTLENVMVWQVIKSKSSIVDEIFKINLESVNTLTSTTTKYNTQPFSQEELQEMVNSTISQVIEATVQVQNRVIELQIGDAMTKNFNLSLQQLRSMEHDAKELDRLEESILALENAIIVRRQNEKQ